MEKSLFATEKMVSATDTIFFTAQKTVAVAKKIVGAVTAIPSYQQSNNTIYEEKGAWLNTFEFCGLPPNRRMRNSSRPRARL